MTCKTGKLIDSANVHRFSSYLLLTVERLLFLNRTVQRISIIFQVNTFISDNNECTLRTHNCHNNATCTNTNGSFSCACDTGYSGNGVTCTGR